MRARALVGPAAPARLETRRIVAHQRRITSCYRLERHEDEDHRTPCCHLSLQALEFQRLVERVRCEFLEMPGLRLTMPQAARLWGLDQPSCEAVVDALVRCEFLQRTASGAVARVDG